MLYYAKEFSDNLLPITKDNLITTIKPLYFELWDKHPGDGERFAVDNCMILTNLRSNSFVGKLAGTKKNKRIHDIVQPFPLVNCHPIAGAEAYLYIIHMEGKFNPVDYNQRVFEKLHSSSNEFGILTTKPLPALAQMSFFVSLGCVEVRIGHEPQVIIVQDELERKLLNNFHNMLFRDVLGIWKAFFSCTSDSYLIVPTCLGTGGHTINWPLVRQFQNLQKPRELNEMERRQMMKSQEQVDYLHKVVNPWYRMEEKQYVVTKVHEELTPMSTFPNSSYETYAEYYLDKYGKRIMVPEQPMIEVKGISTYLNLLSPGAGEAGKSKRYSEWTNTECK
jgi:endoribonuclease Dicer